MCESTTISTYSSPLSNLLADPFWPTVKSKTVHTNHQPTKQPGKPPTDVPDEDQHHDERTSEGDYKEDTHSEEVEETGLQQA